MARRGPIAASNYRLPEQALERKATLLEFSLLGWRISWMVFLVAGYGERPARAFFVYLLVFLGFAAAFFVVGSGTHDALSSPLAAFVFSVTSLMVTTALSRGPGEHSCTLLPR
jgi:hypothetical protein